MTLFPAIQCLSSSTYPFYCTPVSNSIDGSLFAGNTPLRAWIALGMIFCAQRPVEVRARHCRPELPRYLSDSTFDEGHPSVAVQRMISAPLAAVPSIPRKRRAAWQVRECGGVHDLIKSSPPPWQSDRGNSR